MFVIKRACLLEFLWYKLMKEEIYRWDFLIALNFNLTTIWTKICRFHLFSSFFALHKIPNKTVDQNSAHRQSMTCKHHIDVSPPCRVFPRWIQSARIRQLVSYAQLFLWSLKCFLPLLSLADKICMSQMQHLFNTAPLGILKSTLLFGCADSRLPFFETRWRTYSNWIIQSLQLNRSDWDQAMWSLWRLKRGRVRLSMAVSSWQETNLKIQVDFKISKLFWQNLVQLRTCTGFTFYDLLRIALIWQWLSTKSKPL